MAKFVKGESGNPAGRPKGSKNKITLLKQALEEDLRERAQAHMPGVLEKAIELAMLGDRTMLKLLLELHMSKGYSTDERAADKVSIHISTASGEPASEVKEQPVSDLAKEISNG